MRESGRISLLGRHEARLVDDDLVLHRRQCLPFHPNGMRFFAYDAADALVRERTCRDGESGFRAAAAMPDSSSHRGAYCDWAECVTGAKWGVIIGRHEATVSLLERSI